MKELSIEEKAKRYDEALEKAKMILQERGNEPDGAALLSKLFPHLRESDDERIRKKIIQLVNDAITTNSPYKKEMLAWLEKQGEHANFRNKIQIGDKVTRNEDGVLVNLSQLKRVAKPADEKPNNVYDKELSEILARVIRRYINDPNIPYTEREKVSMEIIPYVERLEKQGEQKPADKVEPKFKIGDWIVFNGLTLYVEEVVEGFYRTISKGGITNSYGWDIDNAARLWTIQDAKSGDVLSYRDSQWIFIYKGIVTEDTFKYYALLSEKGITVNDAAFSLLTYCITPATKEQRNTLMKAMADAGYTFDFEKKELKKVEPNSAEDGDLPEFESYLCLMFQKFRTKGMCTNGEIIDYVKEHSQKLKDILVKPAEWSEEDEQRIENLIAIIEGRGYPGEVIWLKNLKNRVQPQPKQEWGEEDEDIINKILCICDDFAKSFEISPASTKVIKEDVDKIDNWLKSLRPQNRWKPVEWSEEDEELRLACIKNLEQQNPLPTSIYTDCIVWLKFLKDRYLPQPKQEWSEEDEKMLTNAIAACNQCYFPKTAKWLKSLSLQKQWKPSEEQMAQLQKYCLDNRPLTLLYEQLKTL